MSIQEQLCRNAACNADGERHSGVAIGVSKELQGGSVGFLLCALAKISNQVEKLQPVFHLPIRQGTCAVAR